MTNPEQNLFQRLALAFYAFFAVLFRPEVALAIRDLREGRGLPPSPPAPAATPPGEATLPAQVSHQAPAAAAPAPAAPPPPREARPGLAALQLLAVLQREGRLVDFIEEDVAAYPDASVGAAARAVHEGCKRAIGELFRLEPVLKEAEGASVEIPAGFDPAAVRLTGNVVGKPPFRGSLRHHGWRARAVSLPPAAEGMDPEILAPAEVEL